MKLIHYLIIVFLLVCNNCFSNKYDLTKYVNPFICTQGDHGHWHPGAFCPGGVVELGPDSYPGSYNGNGDFAHGGYDYEDNYLRGFSHFKQPSSGGGSRTDRAGKLSILPFSYRKDSVWFDCPILHNCKKAEKASAGYYSTTLDKDRIDVELAALELVGFHKYTFAQNNNAYILLGRGNTKGDLIKITETDKTTLKGYTSGVYFVIKCNKSILEFKPVRNQQYLCYFGKLDSPLYIQVGTSLTSIDDAVANLAAESQKTFEDAKSLVNSRWNEYLNRIKVEGNDEEKKTIFYTSLYHACFYPLRYANHDGSFLGMDKQKHDNPGYTQYDGYAFWDSFRTKYTLFGLWLPEFYKNITYSMLDIYKRTDFSKSYPNVEHSPHGSMYSVRNKDGNSSWANCRNEHMLMVVYDAYTKGLLGPDLSEFYKYVKQEMMTQMPEKYDAIGFIPKRPDQTYDYSWDNWSMMKMAKALNKNKESLYFKRRANIWENTWDKTILFPRAKDINGQWLDFPENPEENREKYTYEGTKWQLRFNAIHDVPSMIKLFGGEKEFSKELTYFFDNNLYTAGNQIDLHTPFLFNESGEPWKTQEYVHKLMTEKTIQRYATHSFFRTPIYDYIYKSTPDGYLEEMDDDYGCMSSWHALCAMGMYQICPGDGKYQIFSPIFNEIKIALPNDKTFIIEAPQYSQDCYYIQSATLNGKPLKRSWLTHKEITDGGKLILNMGKEPNKNWGK